MTQIEELRSRANLHIDGDVCQRDAVRGRYGDGWTNGDLAVTIESARNMGGFTVTGTVPDWWPEDTRITVCVNGEPAIEADAAPGRFELRCAAHLSAGVPTVIAVRTSRLAYDAENDRYLGVYVSAILFEAGEPAPFTCNVCGAHVADLQPVLDPEGSLCTGCGANIRLRALAHLVGKELYGETLQLCQFPKTDRVGLGISDSPGFDRHLKHAVPGYTNTQFDSELVRRGAPFLDVTRPDEQFASVADFVTCSEVLEHVEPPVQAAFDGLFMLLRPGGTLIMTVPHTLNRTVEHFPRLHDWRLEQRGSARVLVNHTQDGEVEEFKELNFHGGGRAVLEMRVFGLEDIVAHLRASGFTDIRVRDENVLHYGIFFRYNWSLPITAKRPI